MSSADGRVAPSSPPVLLTIAASDPSGGAGIQADLRVFSALGVAGISAITALTIQDSSGVRSSRPVPVADLVAQIETALLDSRVAAVKIGVMGGAAQIRATASILRRLEPPHVVLDPVIASSTGFPFLDAVAVRALKDHLLPLCELATPNLPEASALTGLRFDQTLPAEEQMERLGRSLLETGARSVLVKGGHLSGDPLDLLVERNGTVRIFRGRRIDTAHSHGTGCLLSSAIAVGLARGDSLVGAIYGARELLRRALLAPVVVGKGPGYPGLLAERALCEGSGARSHAERSGLLRGIYVVTDSGLRPDRGHEEIVRAALVGGCRIAQLRDKTLPTPALISLARRLRHIVHEAGGVFLLNDRVDVALACDADGVHLGPDDMQPEYARALLGPDRLIGVSVSSPEESREVAPFASYLGVGAIFGSRTKGDAGPAVGPEMIRCMRDAYPGHPVVAIGGIERGNIEQVARAGAACAAVLSAVVSAPDMAAATADLRERFDSACPEEPSIIPRAPG